MKTRPINNRRTIWDIILITIMAACTIAGFFGICYVIIEGMLVAWQWVISAITLYLIAIVIEFIKNY